MYLLLAHYSCFCITPIVIADRSIVSITINDEDIAITGTISSYENDRTRSCVTTAGFLAGALTLTAPIGRRRVVTLSSPSL